MKDEVLKERHRDTSEVWGRNRMEKRDRTGEDRSERQRLGNRQKRVDKNKAGRPHITRGRLCHGVNGVLPLPIIPVPFEPWPLHTERSLTPGSASFRAPCLLFIYTMSCQQKPGVCPSNPSTPKSALRTFCRNTPILAGWITKNESVSS